MRQVRVVGLDPRQVRGGGEGEAERGFNGHGNTSNVGGRA
jgi:hypothetical protein